MEDPPPQQQQVDEKEQLAAKQQEVVKTLKECLTHVTTSSVNTRKEIFKQKLPHTTDNEGESDVLRPPNPWFTVCKGVSAPPSLIWYPLFRKSPPPL